MISNWNKLLKELKQNVGRIGRDNSESRFLVLAKHDYDEAGETVALIEYGNIIHFSHLELPITWEPTNETRTSD